MNAQIVLRNASFEEDSHCLNCLPSGWSNCNWHLPDIGPSNIYPDAFYGNNYESLIGLHASSNTWNGDCIQQKIHCPINRNSFVAFNMFAQVPYPSPSSGLTYAPPGRLNIYIGADSCDMSQRTYQLANVDSGWRWFNIKMSVPTGGRYFILQADTIHFHEFVFGIDTIGALTVWDTTTVSADFKTAVILRGDSIQLNATSSSPYDDAWWTEASSGDTIAHILSNVIVTPQTTTQYVACVKICDTCCWWSYDTVTVVVLPQAQMHPFSIPTFISADNSIWHIKGMPLHTAVKLYDEIGREVFTTKNYSNDFDFEGLPAGMYIYELQFSDGTLQKGKIVWAR